MKEAKTISMSSLLHYFYFIDFNSILKPLEICIKKNVFTQLDMTEYRKTLI